MNDNIIYLIIIAIVYLMYQNICNNTIEKMTSESSIEEQVNKVISKIYKADIQAIRNLSYISLKLQNNGLTIPGDLTVEGNINMKDGKSIKSTGQLRIEPNKELYLLPKTGTVLADNIKINGEANVGTNLKVTDYIGCKRLDIKSTDGTTHFNYDNKSKNYIRGTRNQLDGTTNIGKISVRQTNEYTPQEGKWGDWAALKKCPTGEFITGIRTRNEGDQGSGDDTGMNGLRFTCSKIV
jgi:hypothetical protein